MSMPIKNKAEHTIRYLLLHDDVGFVWVFRGNTLSGTFDGPSPANVHQTLNSAFPLFLIHVCLHFSLFENSSTAGDNVILEWYIGTQFCFAFKQKYIVYFFHLILVFPRWVNTDLGRVSFCAIFSVCLGADVRVKSATSHYYVCYQVWESHLLTCACVTC